MTCSRRHTRDPRLYLARVTILSRSCFPGVTTLTCPPYPLLRYTDSAPCSPNFMFILQESRKLRADISPRRHRFVMFPNFWCLFGDPAYRSDRQVRWKKQQSPRWFIKLFISRYLLCALNAKGPGPSLIDLGSHVLSGSTWQPECSPGAHAFLSVPCVTVALPCPMG